MSRFVGVYSTYSAGISQIAMNVSLLAPSTSCRFSVVKFVWDHILIKNAEDPIFTGNARRREVQRFEITFDQLHSDGEPLDDGRYFFESEVHTRLVLREFAGRLEAGLLLNPNNFLSAGVLANRQI